MTAKYDTPGDKFYQLDATSDMWFMTDGFKLVPRATIEVHPNCPDYMLIYIHKAIANGYIKPVVYMHEKEYVWATLEK
jgi:hypothetical protein